MRRGIVIPAFNAGPRLHHVVEELVSLRSTEVADWPILVIDDGSTDGSCDGLDLTQVEKETHSTNLGKGAALQTALTWALRRNLDVVVSLDADGQHPAGEAVRLLGYPVSERTLVLGIRDLRRENAPKANCRSNAFSAWWLSLFTGLRLRDVHCGLRRYPVAPILALGASDPSFAYEVEVILRAARESIPIVEVPVRVHYPRASQRLTHFDPVRDPMRIVRRVILTLIE